MGLVDVCGLTTDPMESKTSLRAGDVRPMRNGELAVPVANYSGHNPSSIQQRCGLGTCRSTRGVLLVQPSPTAIPALSALRRAPTWAVLALSRADDAVWKSGKGCCLCARFVAVAIGHMATQLPSSH